MTDYYTRHQPSIYLLLLLLLLGLLLMSNQ